MPTGTTFNTNNTTEFELIKPFFFQPLFCTTQIPPQRARDFFMAYFCGMYSLPADLIPARYNLDLIKARLNRYYIDMHALP